MIRALPGLPPAAKSDQPSPCEADGATELLRQALAGFLPPTAALFHLFDRLEAPQ